MFTKFNPYIVRIAGPQLIYSSKKILGRQAFDEVKLIYELFKAENIKGTMVDVGAHYGSSLGLFVSDDWYVIAFEPDSINRSLLQKAHGHRANLLIDSRAVSNKPQKNVPFYASNLSSGISSLSQFDTSHYQQQTVNVTTLAEALENCQIQNVDFLKIDTEGHDLFVLQGMNWNHIIPSVIICEFENRKTQPLGYGLNDLYAYLSGKGYGVIISEWEPITQYGCSHRWKNFTDQIDLDELSWGNLIAFHENFALSKAMSIDKLNLLKNKAFGVLHRSAE